MQSRSSARPPRPLRLWPLGLQGRAPASKRIVLKRAPVARGPEITASVCALPTTTVRYAECNP